MNFIFSPKYRHTIRYGSKEKSDHKLVEHNSDEIPTSIKTPTPNIKVKI